MTITTTGLRTWELAFGGIGPLNANDRHGHWGKRHTETRQLRADAAIAARAAGLPALQRARIVYVVRPPKEQKFDPANQYPTVKAYIDGLVKDGLLPDDNGWRLIGPDPRQGDPFPPWGRIELRIAELPPVLRWRCVSAAAAAAVAAAAAKLAPPGIDLEHRAKASGSTVTVMYTDPAYPADLAAWAHHHGHTRKLACPRPESETP